MRLIQHALPPDMQRALERARAQGDRQARFGVGGGCTPRMSPSYAPGENPPGSMPCPAPVELPGCIRPGRTCDATKLPTTLVVAGGTAFEMTITPDKVTWFKPTGVRATITDLTNTDLSHRVLFTAVTINDTPQEAINNINPVAPASAGGVAGAGGSIKGWWSDDWIDPDGYAVPVPYGWISNASQPNVMKIYGIALGLPPATDVLVSVTLYGNGAAQPFAADGSTLTPEQAAQHSRA